MSNNIHLTYENTYTVCFQLQLIILNKIGKTSDAEFQSRLIIDYVDNIKCVAHKFWQTIFNKSTQVIYSYRILHTIHT